MWNTTKTKNQKVKTKKKLFFIYTFRFDIQRGVFCPCQKTVFCIFSLVYLYLFKRDSVHCWEFKKKKLIHTVVSKRPVSIGNSPYQKGTKQWNLVKEASGTIKNIGNRFSVFKKETRENFSIHRSNHQHPSRSPALSPPSHTRKHKNSLQHQKSCIQLKKKRYIILYRRFRQ